MNKDKNAFSLVKTFIRQNIPYILLMALVFFALSLAEEKLSALLLSHGHTYLDYSLAVVRMFFQTALSSILIFIWYKKKDTAVKFTFPDALKLFCSTLLVSLASACMVVTVIGLPFAIWFFLRSDFYMNTFFTTDKKGILSCIKESLRRTKGFASDYFRYNLKYLLFYFIITTILMFLSTTSYLSGNAVTVMSIVSSLFTAIFMPYRFLIKCGFYDEYLNK